MKVTEVISAHGHRNVRSSHKTTLEITKESSITTRGDCIIAVSATKGGQDLSSKFREAAKEKAARITISIEAGGVKDVVKARGTPDLLLTHPKDLVVRKSDYVCGRTVAIGADKAASDLAKELIEKLQNPSQRVAIILTAETI